MRLWLLFETRGLFSGQPLTRLVVHPVTHENVWGRDRDRRDVRFDHDSDPDVPGCCSIFGTDGENFQARHRRVVLPWAPPRMRKAGRWRRQTAQI